VGLVVSREEAGGWEGFFDKMGGFGIYLEMRRLLSVLMEGII